MIAHVSLPRMKPISSRKSAISVVLDVGASKVVCLIAKLIPAESSDMLRGRTHRARILGIGHQRSRGIKAGVVIDMDETEAAVRLAVDAAERMAGVQVESVIVANTGGRLGSAIFTPAFRSWAGLANTTSTGCARPPACTPPRRAAPSCIACRPAIRSTPPTASATPRA